MSDHPSPSLAADSSKMSKEEKLTRRISPWVWIAITIGGFILTLLGLTQAFTTVSCGSTGGIIKSYLVVPMCTSFVGYDYLAGITGIGLVLVSGSKLIRLKPHN